jgi:hypothetical protein
MALGCHSEAPEAIPTVLVRKQGHADGRQAWRQKATGVDGY